MICHNLWHGLFHFYDVNSFIIVFSKVLKLVLVYIHHVGVQRIELKEIAATKDQKMKVNFSLTQRL